LIRVHQAVRDWPSAAILPLALAVALLWQRPRRVRLASIPIALAGLTFAFAGSTTFLDRFTQDPLLGAAPPIAFTTISSEATLTFSVPFGATRLLVGADGRFVALASENEDEQTTFHLGAAGGPLTGFEADAGVFIDESHVLLVSRGRGGLDLQEVALGDSQTLVWEQHVAALSSAQLSFESAGNRWALLASNDSREIVMVEGTVGGNGAVERRWALPRHTVYVTPLTASGTDILALENHYESSPFVTGSLARWAPLVMPGWRVESRFWMLGPAGSVNVAASQFGADCEGTIIDRAPPVCAAFDGSRTRFFEVDPSSARLTALGMLPGRFASYGHSRRGWTSGWWNSRAVALRLETREGVALAPSKAGRVTQIAVAGDVLAALSSSASGSTVRLFTLPRAAGHRQSPAATNAAQ
jgi:hypothetical protein